MKTTSHPRDILSSPWRTFVLYWLPAIAIAVTWNFGDGGRTVVWTATLGVMGAACVANAVRCRRVRCYLTGPFFLVMAVVTLSSGLGVVLLPGDGWNLICLTILVGAVVLCCLPEMILGKYRNGRTRDGDRR